MYCIIIYIYISIRVTGYSHTKKNSDLLKKIAQLQGVAKDDVHRRDGNVD